MPFINNVLFSYIYLTRCWNHVLFPMTVADEHLRKNGKRKPHGGKSPVYHINHHIILNNVSGSNVAVASESAKVVNTQAKGIVNSNQ